MLLLHHILFISLTLACMMGLAFIHLFSNTLFQLKKLTVGGFLCDKTRVSNLLLKT